MLQNRLRKYYHLCFREGEAEVSGFSEEKPWKVRGSGWNSKELTQEPWLGEGEGEWWLWIYRKLRPGCERPALQGVTRDTQVTVAFTWVRELPPGSHPGNRQYRFFSLHLRTGSATFLMPGHRGKAGGGSQELWWGFKAPSHGNPNLLPTFLGPRLELRIRDGVAYTCGFRCSLYNLNEETFRVKVITNTFPVRFDPRLSYPTVNALNHHTVP